MRPGVLRSDVAALQEEIARMRVRAPRAHAVVTTPFPHRPLPVATQDTLRRLHGARAERAGRPAQQQDQLGASLFLGASVSSLGASGWSPMVEYSTLRALTSSRANESGRAIATDIGLSGLGSAMQRVRCGASALPPPAVCRTVIRRPHHSALLSAPSGRLPASESTGREGSTARPRDEDTAGLLELRNSLLSVLEHLNLEVRHGRPGARVPRLASLPACPVGVTSSVGGGGRQSATRGVDGASSTASCRHCASLLRPWLTASLAPGHLCCWPGWQ